MKVIFALRNIANFRHFDEVVQHLCDSGHTVKIIFEQDTKANTTDRALQACLNRTNAVEFEFLPERLAEWSEWQWRMRYCVRDWIDYAFYFKPQHPSRDLNWRYRKHLPLAMRLATHIPPCRALMVSRAVRQRLQRIQERLSLSTSIVQKLTDDPPAVVIASPFVKRSVLEIEFIRAALALRIPTIVAVLSWDNLTSRGTFHAMPDATFVWNQALREEAITLHDVPHHKIFITGAPTFDFWFTMQPSLSRAAFCERTGLDPCRPFVVYLGSSWSIAQDETAYVREFAQSLWAHPDCRPVQILLRPHPLNADIWKEFSADNITVYPRGGEWPDSSESKQDYFNTLFYSEAVMGVNTSAFLEAAIVDKPCVTALTAHYRHTQTGRGHFAHLLNGEFLDIAHSLPEAASRIAAVLRGEDARADHRRRFVRDFIRPRGLHRCASEIFARAVEMVAQSMSAAQIETAIEGVESESLRAEKVC